MKSILKELVSVVRKIFLVHYADLTKGKFYEAEMTGSMVAFIQQGKINPEFQFFSIQFLREENTILGGMNK
jgi:hypothetical protein